MLSCYSQSTNESKPLAKNSFDVIILTGIIMPVKDTIPLHNFYTSIITEYGDTLREYKWAFLGKYYHKISNMNKEFKNYRLIIENTRQNGDDNIEYYEIELDIYNEFNVLLTENLKLVANKPMLLTKKEYKKYRRKNPRMPERSENSRAIDVR